MHGELGTTKTWFAMNTTKSTKFLALVTSYNDEAATLRCLTALLNQTRLPEHILVIDNSPVISDICQKDLAKQHNEVTLLVEWHPENLGIAGAIHFALNYAKRENLSHIWSFDQDSIPEPTALEELANTLKQERWAKHRGLFASLPYEEGTKRFLWGYRFNGFKFEEINEEPEDETYLCDGTITAGTLMPVCDDIEKLLPSIELFIDGVDHALCLNFLRVYGQLAVVRNSQIKHHLGNPSVKLTKITGRRLLVQGYSPMRKFYIARNHTYLQLRAGKTFSQRAEALIWRIRVAAHMCKEALHEEPGLIFASVCSILLGTVLGLVGLLLRYQRLPKIFCKVWK
jgi:rhamnosyltransferase